MDYHVSAPISAFSGKIELELQHLEKTALRHSLQGGRDSPHWVSEQGDFSLFSYFLISCFSCSTGRCRIRSLARQRLAFINVSEKLLYCWRKLFLFKTNGRWYQCDVICVSNVMPMPISGDPNVPDEPGKKRRGGRMGKVATVSFFWIPTEQRLPERISRHIMAIWCLTMFTITMNMLNVTIRHSGVAPTAHLRDTKPTMRYQMQASTFGIMITFDCNIHP